MSPVLDNMTLSLKAHVCTCLGLVLDPVLILYVQLAAVTNSVYVELWLVGQVCSLLDRKDLVMDTLVTFRIGNCNVLFIGLIGKFILYDKTDARSRMQKMRSIGDYV